MFHMWRKGSYRAPSAELLPGAVSARALTPTHKQQVTRAPLSSDQRAHLQLITPLEALNAAQVGESFAGKTRIRVTNTNTHLSTRTYRLI